MLKESVKRKPSAEELLEIPEIQDAVSEYIEVRDQYRRALQLMFIEIVGEDLPDIDAINEKYELRLKRQSDKIAQLVTVHKNG